MKLNYFPDTDSLYIDLRQQPSVESIEVPDGIVLDFGASGELKSSISTMPAGRSISII